MLLDRLKPAKRWFTRQAMGIGGSSVRLNALTDTNALTGTRTHDKATQPVAGEI